MNKAKQEKVLHLAKQLEEHALDHMDAAFNCELKPQNTRNWQHWEIANASATELRRQHARIVELEAAQESNALLNEQAFSE